MNAANIRLAALALLLLWTAVVAAPAAQAQTSTVYLAPFVCGYEIGNVPFLNNPAPPVNNNTYEDVKPGNYATTVTITDLTLSGQTVAVVAQITTSLFSPSPTAIQVPVVVPGQALQGILSPVFSSFEVDCQDIATAAGVTIAPGTTIKGKLLIGSLSNQRLDVVMHETFESQNGFSFLTAFGLDPAGILTAVPFATGSTLAGIQPPFVVGQFFEGVTDIGGAGAGGLGLGVSIDVERCPPIEIDLTTARGGAASFGELLERVGR